MIATILTLPMAGEGARAMAWRQLVDIVAQAGDRLDPDTRAAAHDRIATLRPGVDPAERRNASASLAGRATPEAVAIFACDEPAIAAPVLARAQIDDARWLAMIPTLPPTSRAILRNRRDLSPVVERALASYGPSDFALPGLVAVPAELPVESASQIRALVERIEAFRSQQPLADAILPDPPEPATDPVSDRFTFETMLDGTIDWVEGVEREPLIGLSIGEAAPPRSAGVDGQAAGAFRRRAPFRDARLSVAGASNSSGDWLMTAHPLFDPRSGRFAGYRGEARRPGPQERALRFATAASTPLAPDSLRQLVHELRTPLNAIQGFAEMIDQQMLGPAASAYRDHAQSIIGESRRLLEVVEDLDTSARIDGARSDSTSAESGAAVPCAFDAAAGRIATTLRPALEQRGVTIGLDLAPSTSVRVGVQHVERLTHRLLVTVTSVASAGEFVAVDLAIHGPMATLTVARPRVLLGLTTDAMLDPGFGPDGEWPDAPLLGLGFSLRLLASLARSVGGRFDIGDDAFSLSLPRTSADEARQGEQG